MSPCALADTIVKYQSETYKQLNYEFLRKYNSVEPLHFGYPGDQNICPSMKSNSEEAGQVKFLMSPAKYVHQIHC